MVADGDQTNGGQPNGGQPNRWRTYGFLNTAASTRQQPCYDESRDCRVQETVAISNGMLK